MTRGYFLLAGIALLFLSACGRQETSVTLSPPPTSVNLPPAIISEGQPTAVTNNPAVETAAAASSPTPFETPTLAPTATSASQPADSQSQPVAVDSLPATTHDLLFIADGALKRWQAGARQVVTLLPGGDETADGQKRAAGQPLIVGDVTSYDLSQDGRRALVARLTHSANIANTAAAITTTLYTYELIYLDLETGSRRVLATAVNDLSTPTFTLSPDGRRAAFGALSLGDGATQAVTDARVYGQLYVMDTEAAAPPRQVDTCDGLCQSPVWHQDNNFFVFGDERGLLLYNVSASRPELLAAGDDGSQFGRFFGPISWAKNGRWLLLWLGAGIEGGQQAIFDVPSKQLMLIPHTLQYADPLYAEVTWMQDDRLFMVRAETANGPALGETWRVNVDAGQVQRDESVVLSTDVIHPTAPVHWADGRFGYGLLAENGAPGAGLFRRIAFNEPAERINAVPAALFAPEIAWAPDGAGAAIAHEGWLYYAPANGALSPANGALSPANGALWELSTAVGRWAHSLTWLP
ncbi:MAG: hypothetical protein IPM39_14350 [Chloroflexi bacterium]|nr:hypothetical protein [Chloroflexota bacterium]